MKKNLRLILALIVLGCSGNDPEGPVDCSTVSIAVSLDAQTNVTDCTSNDGSITVSATGGKAPYEFRINGGAFSSSTVFENLTSGTYTIDVRDANGCIGTLLPSPSIVNPNSDLSVSASSQSDTDCLTNNGTVSLTPSGGTAPYTYRFGNSVVFADSPEFNGIAPGNYIVTVKDAEGCTAGTSVTVGRGDTGISWSGEIQSIINTNCAITNCHNGSRSPNLSTLTGVQNNRNQIRIVVNNRTMPPASRPDLSGEQIQKIVCWIDDGAKNN
jgi:hypothetical protein